MAYVKEKVAALRACTWLNWAAAAFTVLVMPLIYQCLIEFIRSGSVTTTLEYVWIHLSGVFIGWPVLVLCFAALVFATARPWVANLLMGGLLVLAGSVNRLKLALRGDPLMPKDLVQAKEAGQITQDMSIGMTREMWFGIAVVVISTLLLAAFKLPVRKGWKSLVARMLVPCLCAAVVPLYVLGYMGKRTVSDNADERLHLFMMPVFYYNKSFVTGFLYLVANTWQRAPSGYSEQTMEALAEALPPSAGDTPDIVVVLLESFFDLSTIEGTSYSEPLTPNYDRLAKEGVSGHMLTDKRGGGTSDFEFSVTTGFAVQLMPPGSVPMVEYVNYDNYPSAPYYYGQKGYRTVGIHPYLPDFYHRDTAYAHMGINEFYSIDDFDPAGKVGDYMGDAAFGDKVIEEYEKSLAADENVYIHAVSIQNHPSYGADRYPEGYGVQATSGMGEEYDAILSTYATGVRDTDALIGRLCDYFATVDREVVLLFYGDHQGIITDETVPDLYPQLPAYQGASPTDQWLMTHQTPYLMWSNTDRTARDGGLLAPYMLMPTLCEAYGVEAPAYYGWLAEQEDVGGGVIGGWYILPDGTITTTPTDEQVALLEKQALFQYDALFGKGYVREKMFG